MILRLDFIYCYHSSEYCFHKRINISFCTVSAHFIEFITVTLIDEFSKVFFFNVRRRLGRRGKKNRNEMLLHHYLGTCLFFGMAFTLVFFGFDYYNYSWTGYLCVWLIVLQNIISSSLRYFYFLLYHFTLL